MEDRGLGYYITNDTEIEESNKKNMDACANFDEMGHIDFFSI